MKTLSLTHIKETNHKIKTMGKLYKDIDLSGIETLETWDECENCDFKTEIEIDQRRKKICKNN